MRSKNTKFLLVNDALSVLAGAKIILTEYIWFHYIIFDLNLCYLILSIVIPKYSYCFVLIYFMLFNFFLFFFVFSLFCSSDSVQILNYFLYFARNLSYVWSVFSKEQKGVLFSFKFVQCRYFTVIIWKYEIS